MQGEYGLDEVGDAGGRAAQFAEETPGFEGGDGLLDEGSDLRVRPVDDLLACAEVLPAAPAGDTERASRAPISLVRPALDASVSENVDDAVLAGGPGRRG